MVITAIADYQFVFSDFFLIKKYRTDNLHLVITRKHVYTSS
jgi:hypothetical protein